MGRLGKTWEEIVYTVMRVSARPEQDEVVRHILEMIAQIRPDVNAARRRRDGVVVCDIARDGSWHEHQVAVVRFIKDCSASIQRAFKSGLSVSFDVGVDSADMAPHPYFCLHCGVELMKTLVEHGAALEFTVYGCYEAPVTENAAEQRTKSRLDRITRQRDAPRDDDE
jgi:hypothetical protein